MSTVIVGRVVSGMGGAGIMAMGSIIILGTNFCNPKIKVSLLTIPDVVPKRDLAAWRAIVNISMTLGRSIGGPVGGWLTDTIGWRWYGLSPINF